ncbi:MAG: PD-(D/E)XK nuclease family transposase [Erysipelotrichaceae bacterium]|nr:PD-(D/E)XK nuclease family transposase [Erysipelotrichaceae bacterium]
MQNTLESLHLSVFKETEVYETHFELMDKRTGILLTEKMKAHMIELNKAAESVKEKQEMESLNLLQKWALFLTGYADERKREVISKIEESDEVFRLATKVLEMVNDDKLARDRAIARERYLKDQAQLAWEVEQNMKKQYELGLQEGAEKGRSEAQMLMIKEMLKLHMEESMIVQIAHCTLKQIEQVKERMKEGK